MIKDRNSFNRPLPKPGDKWDSRFGWFWYNDQEIFYDSEEQIEEKVKKFADQKVNHLITFSCTHFRWNYYRYWDKIIETVATLVRCCHKHDIYLTEHASATLMSNPVDMATEEYWLTTMKLRKSDPKNWAGVLEDAKNDMETAGIMRSAMLQVDGRTGKFTYHPYKGYVMCPNNPDYRERYFAYLEEVYETGIDGIMTDDIHFFGQGCACPHCRKLFKWQFGYDLPECGEEWVKWYDNYENPGYRAYIYFRHRSIEDYNKAVLAAYTRNGRDLLRVNYVSHALNKNYSFASSMETVPKLDWVFKEACYSHVIRYSWICCLLEQGHRCMVARRRNIPPMIMFYPIREDDSIFAWGLSRLTGSLFTATPEGEVASFNETPVREFEQEHYSLLFASEKLAVLGIYDSLRNRELNKNYWHLNGTNFLMQTCLTNNIQYNLIQAEDAGDFKNYEAIFLYKLALLSEEEIGLLRAYVSAGGTLIIYRPAGTLDSAGATRETEEAENLWGFKFDFPSGKDVKELDYGKGKYVFFGEELGKSFPFIENDGREVPDSCEYMYDCCVSRWQGETTKPYDGKYQKVYPSQQALAEKINIILGQKTRVSAKTKYDGVLVSFYRAGNSYVIHLLNAVDTFKLKKGDLLSHEDPIPFPELDGDLHLELTLKEGETPVEASYFCLTNPNVGRIAFSFMSNKVVLQFSLALLKDYGFLQIKLK